MLKFHPPLHRSAVHGTESALHGLSRRLFPQRKKYDFCWLGWLGGAAWTVSQPGPSVRGKQARVSAGRELHALFASELSHVTVSSTKGWGGWEAWIHALDGYKTWLVGARWNIACLKKHNLSYVYFIGNCICDSKEMTADVQAFRNQKHFLFCLHYLHACVLTFRPTHCECASRGMMS